MGALGFNCLGGSESRPGQDFADRKTLVRRGRAAPPCGAPVGPGEKPQIRATPDFLAASATALATAGPTLGSKALGMM